MSTWLWIVGYLASVLAAFWVFQNDWRRDRDLSLGQAVGLALLSLLGPASLLIGLIGEGWLFIRGKLPTNRTILRRHT